MPDDPSTSAPPTGVELVERFLKAQNLEQVGRVDEAIALYESTVEAGFDSPGPYDRLIELYSGQAAHRDVIRIADLALLQVQSYEDKRVWYAGIRDAAARSAASVPDAAPRKPLGAE